MKIDRNTAKLEELLEEMTLKDTLKYDISLEEFFLEYQPQVNVVDGTLHGMEALLRWESPMVGRVSPGKFIPMAEKSGAIHALGYFALEQAVKSAKNWLDAGYVFNHIAVNVSPIELGHPLFTRKLFTLLEKHQLAPSYLQLEVTEGIHLDEVDNSKETINQLAALGIPIALDDFGKEYANFQTLLQIEASTLKIDKSIIDALDAGNGQPVVKSLIHYKQNTNCMVIAEGVETEKQVNQLRDLGCNIIQGYVYSKPLSFDEMTNKL